MKRLCLIGLLCIAFVLCTITAALADGFFEAQSGETMIGNGNAPQTEGAWICGSCQFKNAADKPFCKACGAAKPGWTCIACGALNDKDAAYCKNCGLSGNANAIWKCIHCGAFNDGKFCGDCGGGMLNGNAVKGDTVEFGRYGGDSIEWQVLENDGQALYLLSEYGLEAMPYNERAENTTWETCSLRAWLNDDFFFNAFNADERARMSALTETNDNVSLLGIDEIDRYFNVDAEESTCSEALVCMPSKAALNNGATIMSAQNKRDWQKHYGYTLQRGACWWWLRSQGDSAKKAVTIGTTGEVSVNTGNVELKDGCVRPFIKVLY